MTPDEKFIWDTIFKSEKCIKHEDGGFKAFESNQYSATAVVCCNDFSRQVFAKFREMAIGKEAREDSLSILALQ